MSSATMVRPGNDGQRQRGNAGGWHAVPNISISLAVADRLSLGMGISAPFGLATEYDRGWVGTGPVDRSEMRTINYNPSLAYRVSDKVSLGFGVNYQKIDAELTNAGGVLKGDDSTWGWNAGALFHPVASHAGRSFLSFLDEVPRGNAEWRNAGQGGCRTAGYGDPVGLAAGVRPLGSDGRSVLHALELAEIAGRRQPGQRETSFLAAGETFNYDNSWRIAWGAAYRMNEQAKLKFGIAYDRTPVRDADRSPGCRITAVWAVAGRAVECRGPARSMSATAISTCVTRHQHDQEQHDPARQLRRQRPYRRRSVFGRLLSQRDRWVTTLELGGMTLGLREG